MPVHLTLLLAVAAEVVATTALARTEGFTRLGPTALSLAFYAIAFWLLSFALRELPTGIVYAVWSGLGVVLIAAVSWLLYGQKLDLPAMLGIGLILAGVLVINLFSRSVEH